MEKIDGYIEWNKENPSDKVWWGTIFHGISEADIKSGKVTDEELNNSMGWGDQIFSFDKKKVFWLFKDYPKALTESEKAVFDKENPFWADFFKSR